jgi:hypothetical protein
MTKRSVRGDLLRRALAQEAARIMSEHGIDDYGFAKRKAAERLGVTDQAVLPKNTEIESALAEHQRLFESGTHDDELAGMRRTAVEAMRVLAPFEPRLVGPVLAGTATPHAEIHLHVFADTPETVAFKLLDQGIPHRMVERRVKVHRDESVPFPAIRFVAGEHEVDATVFPRDGIRQAPMSPVDGRPMRRASLTEVEALLQP